MLKKITILGGNDKDRTPEGIRRLDIRAGEVLSVVGPTGSGKSQLIADVEQYAEEETLTGRSILVDDRPVDKNRHRGSLRYMVAQVSQNMHFVIDMPIGEFLLMHAQVRAIDDPIKTIKDVLAIANRLSGEPISLEMNLSQLSGGQSRALMVADVALISDSPVVLIDEIENAGINRLQALDILTGRGKIVLVVSHDPTLILMAGKRVVMKNGGMYKVFKTTLEEKQILENLIKIDKEFLSLKEKLRKGKSIRIDWLEKKEATLWPKY